VSETRSQLIGVIGAGTMGSDIAHSAALGGFTVRLYDSAPAARAAALAKIGKTLARGVEKERLTQAQADAVLARVQPVEALEALAPCEIIIEAIIENFEAKAGLFEAVSAVAGERALLATNTSSLRVSDLAHHVKKPARFVGLHYFFPASINPLLEIIRGEASSDAAVDQALDFARSTGKTPVLCRDVFGFAVNRFFVPYLNEAARLVEEGNDAAAIEACALREFEASVGPFKVMDLTKTIIAVHAAETLAQLGAFYRPTRALIEQGESGRAWAVEPAQDPGQCEGIRQRLLGAVFLPVLQALDQQVASAADLDLGAKLALQWGRQPCQLMDTLGQDRVRAMLQPLLQAHATAMPAAIERVGRLRSSS
jgi:3-hydroxybutyryl-CoA dehydrogenase